MKDGIFRRAFLFVKKKLPDRVTGRKGEVSIRSLSSFTPSRTFAGMAGLPAMYFLVEPLVDVTIRILRRHKDLSLTLEREPSAFRDDFRGAFDCKEIATVPSPPPCCARWKEWRNTSRSPN